MIYYQKALQMGAISIGLAALAAGSPSYAASKHREASQSPKEKETASLPVLPEMTVASHMLGVPYSQTGVSVSVIDPEQFEKRGIETMTGALSKTPGIYMLDGGSIAQRGSVGKMVVRGIGGRGSSTLLVDGMRVSDDMNIVGTGPDDFYGLTELFTLGGLEVVKGPQGAVYGGNTTGAVVSMTTPEGSGKPSLRIYNEAGSNDSYTGYVMSRGTVKKLSYFVAAGYETTKNDTKLVGLPSNLSTNDQNNDFHQWNEALRLDYKVNDDVTLHMTYRRTDARFNQPYLMQTWYPDVTIDGVERDIFRTRMNVLTTSVDAKVNEFWSTTFMMGYYDRHFQDQQPAGVSDHASSYDHSKFQTEWRNALTWNKKWTTTLGMAWDRTEMSGDWLSEQTESNLAFFGEQLWAPTDAIDLSLALRLEHSTIWGNNFTWRYSNSWKVTGKDSPTRLIGSIGSGFRAPTDFEKYALYSQSGYNWVGNPDLSISRSLGGDIGVEQRIADSHYVTLTGFWTRISNPILTAMTPSYDSTWKNAGYATSIGMELSFKGEFDDAWKSGYSVSYTYAMPQDNEGHQLVGTARHTINAEIHTSPMEKLTTGFGVTAALKRTDSLYKNPFLDDYCTVRWFARYQVTENLALHVRVENLMNERYTTSILTNSPNNVYSQAWGTAVYGGVTLDF